MAASTWPGLASWSSSARQALRSWPMTVAAPRSWPTQSPTTIAMPPVRESDDVVPVAAYLERAGGGLVTGAEARGELRRAEDRALQRECGLALLVDLVRPVQGLAEAAADQAEQRLVLHGRGPGWPRGRSISSACLTGARGPCRRRRPAAFGVSGGCSRSLVSAACTAWGSECQLTPGTLAVTDGAVASRADGGDDTVGVPEPVQLGERFPQGVGHAGGAGQHLPERGERALALDGVVLRGDVTERSHDQPARSPGP